MSTRAKAQAALRWRELLSRWLDCVPGDEWSGTASELSDELRILCGPGDYVNRHLSNDVERLAGFIATKGWNLEFTRTASARLIRFTRRRR